MIINEIDNKWKEYFKEKNIIGKQAMELVRVAYKNMSIDKRTANQEMTDEDTIKVIQKVVKNLNEEYISISQVTTEVVTEKLVVLTEQINMLEVYLPKQLTEDEIRAEIDEHWSAENRQKCMPEIMKHFKEHFNGKVDMKLVSQIAKS